jgi:uncharacterized membrane protein YgcG
MARSLLTSLALIGMTLTSGIALAGDGTAPCTSGNCVNGGFYGDTGYGSGWNQFWHRMHVDFYRNNTWPEPFLTADKMAVRTPYCIQADNGWKMQNTVGSFLFDGDTQQVNQAGELLVKWIVTQAPVHRRAVFVLRGDNAMATNARVQSVQAAVAKYANGCVCPVLLTDTEPAGWSASYIDTITQQYSATIPAPRLPARQSASGGSGGSSTGGSSTGGSSTSSGGVQ